MRYIVFKHQSEFDVYLTEKRRKRKDESVKRRTGQRTGSDESKKKTGTHQRGANYNVLGLVGDTTALTAEKAYLVSRTRVQAFIKGQPITHPEDSVIDVSGARSAVRRRSL